MNYFNNFKGLGRQVYILCLVRILCATGCIASFMTTLHYTNVLGLSSAVTGVLISCNYAASVLGTIVGGKAADRFSRKNTAIALILITGVCLLFSAATCRTVYCIPPLTIAFAGGYAAFPVLSAMIADCCVKGKSQESFSLMYLGQNIGFAVGPSLGGFMFYDYFVAMFVVGAVFYIAAAILIAVYGEDNYDRAGLAMHKDSSVTTSGREGTLALLVKIKPLLVFVIAMVAISFIYNLLNFLLGLHLADLFGLEYGSKYSGYVWGYNGMTVLFLTSLILNFTRKHHQFYNMTIACVFYAAGFVIYAFTKNHWMFYVGAIIWTIGEIMINTGSAAFIAANSPKTHVARFQSTQETATALGKTLGPIFYGAVLPYVSYRAFWLFGVAVWLTISAFMLVSYRTLIVKGNPNE